MVLAAVEVFLRRIQDEIDDSEWAAPREWRNVLTLTDLALDQIEEGRKQRELASPFPTKTLLDIFSLPASYEQEEDK
tara:strand:- start:523 stop:753 length:231 start_codon:yes stop_codon:yes gene_type:complete